MLLIGCVAGGVRILKISLLECMEPHMVHWNRTKLTWLDQNWRHWLTSLRRLNYIRYKSKLMHATITALESLVTHNVDWWHIKHTPMRDQATLLTHMAMNQSWANLNGRKKIVTRSWWVVALQWSLKRQTSNLFVLPIIWGKERSLQEQEKKLGSVCLPPTQSCGTFLNPVVGSKYKFLQSE